MNLRKSLQSFRLLLRAATLLVAAGLFAPSAARAGCGDYVILGSSSHGNALTQPTPTTDHAAPAPDPLRPRPCHGPACSGDVPNLPPVPVIPVSLTGQEWACDNPTREGGLSENGRRLPEDEASGSPVRQPSSIFHPPRP